MAFFRKHGTRALLGCVSHANRFRLTVNFSSYSQPMPVLPEGVK